MDMTGGMMMVGEWELIGMDGGMDRKMDGIVGVCYDTHAV
jgi:hypothetical protein